MPKATKLSRKPAETRQLLIDATVRLMLRQGFSATTVEQICSEAGLTKGSFFHYFETKEAIGRAAVEWWGNMGTALYAAVWADSEADPLDQLHRMFDIMVGFTERPDESCVCVVGMMSQELAQTHPEMRAACNLQLQIWSANVAKMLAAAKKTHRPRASFDPESVAWFLNSLWQGSMLVAKTRQNQKMIASNLRHARSYVDGLLGK